MRLSNFFLTAASSLALVAMLGAPASAADKDANGDPCVGGHLDGALQCMKEPADTSAHPYRRAGVSDPRLAKNAGFSPYWSGYQPRLFYAAVPGSIVVLDPMQHYKFVKRIVFDDRPAQFAREGISAMMGSPATNMLYVSTRGHLIAIDLATEKVAWNNAYKPGTCCERGQVTPDGLTLEVGSDLKDFHYVIDAKTGAVKGTIPTPKSMFNHNMNMRPDGKVVFDAPNGNTLTVASMETLKPIKTITFSDHIRPFVINHDGSKIYANLNNLLGFEIADVASGKVVKRIEAPAEMWKAKWADPNQQFFGHGAPMHGIAMTPDESEIWLADAINNQVLVYDNPINGEWPTLNMKKTFKTNGNPNGWITMGLDGKYAYMASGDVVDVRTHKIVDQLKDEYGRYMDSEKVLEVEFDRDGKMSRVVNQFAIGDPQAYAARVAKAKGNKEARAD